MNLSPQIKLWNSGQEWLAVINIFIYLYLYMHIQHTSVSVHISMLLFVLLPTFYMNLSSQIKLWNSGQKWFVAINHQNEVRLHGGRENVGSIWTLAWGLEESQPICIQPLFLDREWAKWVSLYSCRTVPFRTFQCMEWPLWSFYHSTAGFNRRGIFPGSYSRGCP